MTAVQNGHGLLDLGTAAAAAATEAEQQPFSFTYKGEEYTIPAGRDWPVAAVGSLAAGELNEALPLLLGVEEYDRLMAAGLTTGELRFLFDQVGQAAGFPSLPNSPLPARPSSTRT